MKGNKGIKMRTTAEKMTEESEERRKWNKEKNASKERKENEKKTG